MSRLNHQQYAKVSTDSEELLSEDSRQSSSSEDLLEKSFTFNPTRRGRRQFIQKGAAIGGIFLSFIALLVVGFLAGRASVDLTECGKRLSPWCKIPVVI